MHNPKLLKIKQHFSATVIPDPADELKKQLDGFSFALPAGAQIAVAVGSRGIANIAELVKGCTEYLQKQGYKPFIVPAMGSHGGATAEGQAAVLESYGITEETMSVPILSSMEVVELSNDFLPSKYFIDRKAWEADGIILINRVKPHTDFHGPLESGLVKMAVIGLGNHRQAMEIHSAGVQGLCNHILPCAEKLFSSGKVLCGIALVENAYDQTMVLKLLRPEEIVSEERELLKLARENMPLLPLDDIDVLIVDEIGKNISGVCIDTNIIGRMRIRGVEEPKRPSIKTIIACSLSESSHGNAIGVGLADIITEKLYKSIDFDATYENALTSTFFERAKVPLIADTPLEALNYGLRASNIMETDSARIIRIKNSLNLEYIEVSSILAQELKGREDIEILSEEEACFDRDGELRPLTRESTTCSESNL